MENYTNFDDKYISNLTDEELIEFYERDRLYKDFIKLITEELINRLKIKNTIGPYCVTDSLSNRKWSYNAEHELKKQYGDMFFKKEISLVSVPEAYKIVQKNRGICLDDIEKYIVRVKIGDKIKKDD